MPLAVAPPLLAWEVHDGGSAADVSHFHPLSAVQTDVPSGAKRAIFSGVVFLLSLMLFEMGSFVAIGILVHKGWMAFIPEFTEVQKDLYFRDRDTILGWAFVTDSTWGPATDSEGLIHTPIARPDPASATLGAPCASAYGDSFVYGTETSASGSYPHHLALLLGCAIHNFGVPGYGSDQGVMLFRAQARVDSAPVVIFQHLTENVLRNVNRYANLLYPGSPLRFKPRFVLSEDSIVYLAAPVSSDADFQRVIDNPDSALTPDGLLDRPRPGFPFTGALLLWLTTDIKLRARVTGVPVEANYYSAGHPARGFDVTVAIMSAAVSDASEHGKRGVVLLQTTRQGLIHARDTGRWMDQTLYDTLRARGLPVIHAGPRVLATLGDRHPCELFEECVQTHLNSEGNYIVATIVADYLRTEGFIAPAKTDQSKDRVRAP
jgi:hypothetical protein